MSEIIRLEVCFRNNVQDMGNLTATRAFQLVSDWQRQPGTNWIRVRINNVQVYEYIKNPR